MHSHYSSDHVVKAPHKFHESAVPRIGGISVIFGLIVSMSFMLLKDKPGAKEISLLLICSSPAFLSGLWEDINKKVGVKWRLLFTMIAAAMAFFMLNGKLIRLSVPLIDSWLLFMPFSFALTIIAVAGISHAINIIDGYNGLAGVVSCFIFAAMAYISFKVGDSSLLSICLASVGAILGFIVWNYPNGLIFLGDGGAYLLGFFIAEISILMVNRHSEVSPWFPMLLVIYPVCETLFSIYRKKVLRGRSPGIPDGLHFHMMIYKRLLRFAVGNKEAHYLLKRNSMTSPYLWGISLFGIIPAILLWRDTVYLVIFVFIFIIAYLWLYGRIVKFKTPRWLVWRKKRNR